MEKSNGIKLKKPYEVQENLYEEKIDQPYAIQMEQVEKYFKLYADKGDTAKEKFLFWKRNRYEKKQILKGVCFQIKKGEAVGLIGHNGCGKSTILKLMTRIMYPDKGIIRMNGRVSSLLELGAGFHPDMNGIENIYINASIFGLSKREIDTKVNDIIEFAELDEYINNPVRTYSSGMYMRLAFAVAVHVNADILLIDEILAVGDVKFQAKCFSKMLELKKSGVTIVLVSHSTEQIASICDRSIWIHDGRVQADGVVEEVHREYLKYMGEGDIQEEKNYSQEESNKREKEKQEERIEQEKVLCKLYFNKGAEFCKENFCEILAVRTCTREYECVLDLEIEEQVNQVRFQPVEHGWCFVTVSEIFCNNQQLDSNWVGKIFEYGGVLLDNFDSYVIWNMPNSQKKRRIQGRFCFISESEYIINKMVEYLKNSCCST